MQLVNEKEFEKRMSKAYWEFYKRQPAERQRAMRTFVRHNELLSKKKPRAMAKGMALYCFTMGNLE